MARYGKIWQDVASDLKLLCFCGLTKLQTSTDRACGGQRSPAPGPANKATAVAPPMSRGSLGRAPSPGRDWPSGTRSQSHFANQMVR